MEGFTVVILFLDIARCLRFDNFLGRLVSRDGPLLRLVGDFMEVVGPWGELAPAA